jgi:hypothetical protein
VDALRGHARRRELTFEFCENGILRRMMEFYFEQLSALCAIMSPENRDYYQGQIALIRGWEISRLPAMSQTRQ